MTQSRHKLQGRRRAFTLIEILVVIGIIVLLILVAVPALSLITGSRSIDRAENNVSAMLGRARADALGLQRDTGVFFYLDPVTQGVTLAEVFATDAPNPPAAGIEVYLDILADRDFLPLPKGVGAQVIDNANIVGGVRQDDGYIGYNTAVQAASAPPPPAVAYGGVILFDAQGRLVSRSYAFRGMVGASTTVQTAISHLLHDKSVTATTTGNVLDLIPPTSVTVAPNNVTRSAFGLILFDREAFLNNGNDTDSQVNSTGTNNYAVAGSGDLGEESWLDENSVPLMVNRYNGTLVRGE